MRRRLGPDYGIRLEGGGEVINDAGGSIQAATGVYLGTGTYGAASTVINAGGIHGGVGPGVRIGGSGSFVAGGSVTNQSGGSISGGGYGIELWNTRSSSASVVNYQGATIGDRRNWRRGVF